MDRSTFDDLTRSLAASDSRRGALKGLAAAGAALVGARVVAGATDAQSVDETLYPDGNKGPEKQCKKNKNCGKGLYCHKKNQDKKNGRCKYKNGRCGKKNDTCDQNADCCGGFKCKNRQCVRV